MTVYQDNQDDSVSIWGRKGTGLWGKVLKCTGKLKEIKGVVEWWRERQCKIWGENLK